MRTPSQPLTQKHTLVHTLAHACSRMHSTEYTSGARIIAAMALVVHVFAARTDPPETHARLFTFVIFFGGELSL